METILPCIGAVMATVPAGVAADATVANLRRGDRHRGRRLPVGGGGDQFGDMLFDEARMDETFEHILAADQRVQEPRLVATPPITNSSSAREARLIADA